MFIIPPRNFASEYKKPRPLVAPSWDGGDAVSLHYGKGATDGRGFIGEYSCVANILYRRFQSSRF